MELLKIVNDLSPNNYIDRIISNYSPQKIKDGLKMNCANSEEKNLNKSPTPKTYQDMFKPHFHTAKKLYGSRLQMKLRNRLNI